MAFSSGSGAAAEINVTPLVDVLLVLLIIFMVIGPTLAHGLDSSVPQGPAAVSTTTAPVTVRVIAGPGGVGVPRYRVGEQEMAFDEIRPALTRIFATRPVRAEDRALFVDGDRELNYRDVARVAGEARAAGAGSVAFETKADRR
jgi:biopolymer transport protein TolR